ncbi:MAG: HIT family protein [Chloroflexota bacterium]
MYVDGCLSCEILLGKVQVAGGIIYEDAYWMVAMGIKPLRSPYYPFIILKRHCEHIHELSQEESVALGLLMQRIAQVLMDTAQPAKVHFGIYAEQVKHIHVHVTPRMPSMPAGNKPNQKINRLYEWLAKRGMKQPIPDEMVAEAAEKMRMRFQELEEIS